MWTVLENLGYRAKHEPRAESRAREKHVRFLEESGGLHLLPTTGSVTDLESCVSLIQRCLARHQWVFLVDSPFDEDILLRFYPVLSDKRVVNIPVKSYEAKHWALLQALNHPLAGALLFWHSFLDSYEEQKLDGLAQKTQCFCGQFVSDDLPRALPSLPSTGHLHSLMGPIRSPTRQKRP
ncbi:hypothetical protein FEMY_21260 [Ferrovum myxofaciens]|uniref:Uncharacterized protein n=2 Tax=root TaxID=1 RepID=A0A149VW00_9PROT|nr:hypothetical protein FEMY_21260 [Ferrovum myxofaciens]